MRRGDVGIPITPGRNKAHNQPDPDPPSILKMPSPIGTLESSLEAETGRDKEPRQMCDSERGATTAWKTLRWLEKRNRTQRNLQGRIEKSRVQDRFPKRGICPP